MPKYNRFNYRPYKLGSCMMGELIPLGIKEVLPGDLIDHNCMTLLRCTPLVTPPMHPVEVRIHHWFVPHRIVWDDWNNFITGGEDGLNASVFPTISFVNPAVGSLADYYGIPNGTYTATVSALPFRGYSLIWNEWYRFQKLQTALTIDKTDGADTTTNTTLQNCTWMRDRFTAAFEDTQLGAEVTIPLGTEAPIKGLGKLTHDFLSGSNAVFESDDTNPTYNPSAIINGSGTSDYHFAVQSKAGTGGNIPYIRADLSNASAASINEWREQWAIQRYREHSIMYGARINEYLMRAFGVRGSDARLQKPEYLGGGKAMIQFSEVLQTSNDGTNGEVGELFGHGISFQRSNRYRKFFEEHGYIHTFLSVRPKTIYADGIEKHFLKAAKEDFYQPEFAHIGLQPLQNREVRAVHATPAGTFAYSPPYDEYRYMPSTIAGLFRSTYNDWHFARLMGSDPAFNSDFVKCVPAVRPFADQSNDTLLFMARHKIKALRNISKTGTPGGI